MICPEAASRESDDVLDGKLSLRQPGRRILFPRISRELVVEEFIVGRSSEENDEMGIKDAQFRPEHPKAGYPFSSRVVWTLSVNVELEEVQPG